MWTPLLSILFRIFLPQTACASICCIVNKSLVPAYPCLTDIEISSAFFMMRAQLCLALDILLLYMISLGSQHVLRTFPWNSSMVFFCLSLLPGMFLFLLPSILCLSLRHRAPQIVLSLSPPFWLFQMRRLAALLIQLGYSFSKIHYIPCVSFIWAEGRDITRSPLTVDWAVQFYLVTSHGEKKITSAF